MEMEKDFLKKEGKGENRQHTWINIKTHLCGVYVSIKFLTEQRVTVAEL